VSDDAEGGQDEDEQQPERRDDAEQVVLDDVRLREHRAGLLRDFSGDRAIAREPILRPDPAGASGRPSPTGPNDRPKRPWTDDDPGLAGPGGAPPVRTVP